MERRAEASGPRSGTGKRSVQVATLAFLLVVAAVLWVVRMRPAVLMAGSEAAVSAADRSGPDDSGDRSAGFQHASRSIASSGRQGVAAGQSPWATYDALKRDLFAWQSLLPQPEGLQQLPPDVQILRERIRQAAGTLRVQALLVGERPRVVIDGQSFQPGDRVAGFQVLEILRDRVRLQREGVIVDLP